MITVLILAAPAAAEDAITSYNRGVDSLNKGETGKAIEAFTEAIRLDPKSPDAYNGRGLARYHKNQHDKAIGDYTAAIKLSPKYRPAYNNRGNALVKKGE